MARKAKPAKSNKTSQPPKSKKDKDNSTAAADESPLQQEKEQQQQDDDVKRSSDLASATGASALSIDEVPQRNTAAAPVATSSLDSSYVEVTPPPESPPIAPPPALQPEAAAAEPTTATSPGAVKSPVRGKSPSKNISEDQKDESPPQQQQQQLPEQEVKQAEDVQSQEDEEQVVPAVAWEAEAVECSSTADRPKEIDDIIPEVLSAKMEEIKVMVTEVVEASMRKDLGAMSEYTSGGAAGRGGGDGGDAVSPLLSAGSVQAVELAMALSALPRDEDSDDIKKRQGRKKDAGDDWRSNWPTITLCVSGVALAAIVATQLIRRR